MKCNLTCTVIAENMDIVDEHVRHFAIRKVETHLRSSDSDDVQKLDLPTAMFFHGIILRSKMCQTIFDCLLFPINSNRRC